MCYRAVFIKIGFLWSRNIKLRSRGSPRLRLLPLIFNSSSVFAAVRFLIISDIKVSRHQAEVAGFSATEAIATHNQKFPGRCRRLVFISIAFLSVRIIKLMLGIHFD